MSTEKVRLYRRPWVRRTLIGLLVVAVLVRIAVPLALPAVLSAWAEGQGLVAEYEELDLSVLTGEVDLWHLDLARADAGDEDPSVLHVEYATLDFDVSSLFVLRPRLGRLEVDGLDLALERDASGSLVWPAPVDPAAPEQEVGSEPDDEPAESGPPANLALPFEVAAVRLQEVRVDFLDRSLDPPRRLQLELSARLSDLGSETRPARLEVRAASPQALDALRVTVRAEHRPEGVDADLELELVGLAPRELAPWLTPLGLKPVADRLEGRVAATLTARAPAAVGAPLALALESMTARFEADDEVPLDVDRVAATLELAADGLRVPSVRIEGVTGRARRTAEGRLAVAGFELVPTDSVSIQSDPESTEAADDSTPTPVRLDELVVEDVALLLDDGAVAPPVQLELRLEELELTGLALPGESSSAPAALEARLSVPGAVESIELSGDLALGGPSGSAELAWLFGGVHLERLEPYLREAGLEPTLDSGMLGGRLRADFETEGQGGSARLVLEGVQFTDRGRVLAALDGVLVEGVQWGDEGVRVERVDVGGLRTELERGAEGAVEVVGLRTLAASTAAPEGGPEAEPSTPEGSTAPSPSEAASRFELVQFTFTDARVQFRDAGVEPPVELSLEDVAFELTGLVLDEGAPTTATLRGELALPGVAERVTLEGTVAPALAPLRLDAELEARLEGLSTTGLESYLEAADVPARVPRGSMHAGLRARVAETDGGLRVEAHVDERLRLEYVPGAAATPVEVDLTAVLDLEPWVVGGEAPAVLRAELTLAGAVDSLVLDGELDATDEATRVSATLTGRGLREGPLAAFLPPGMELAFDRGALDLALSAELLPHAEGGQRLAVELSDLAFADGERSLVRLASARLSAERIDPEAGRFELSDVVLRGVELDARRVAADRLEVAGVALVTVEDEPDPDPEVAATEPVTPEVPASTSPEVPADRAAEPAPLPRVTLANLEVGIARFTFLDETQPGAEPLVASAKLTSPGELVLLDADPEELEPLVLVLRATAEPVVRDVRLTASLAPYAESPELQLDLVAEGIRGEGLTRILPELAQTLDGSELEDGVFEAGLRASLDWRRRSAVDFDLANGFGGEVELRELAWRARPDGDELFGLDGLELELARVSPTTGDVHVTSLELVRPRLHLRQTERGLHLLGLVLLPEEAQEEGETAEQVAAAEGEPVEASSEREPDSIERTAELRLDRLLVEGIDVSFVDETVAPPMRVPLTELDLVVSDFTTRAFEEQRRVRYSLYLGAGEVPLPERMERSFLGGLASAATNLVTGEPEGELEERRLFDELSLRGDLVLHPALQGTTRVELTGLELLGFAGAAADAGVTIGDGVMDTSVEVDLEGEEGVEVSSRTAFQYLSLDEPAGGPISRYLNLPAPLDTVLFVLKNDDGEHVIPLAFELDGAGSLSATQVARTAGTTLGRIIADAIASSPLRVLGGVTDLVGLTGGEEAPLEDELARIVFPVADPEPPIGAAGALEVVVERLEDEDELAAVLTHRLGLPELERVEVLANPDPDDCRELARGLRQKKVRLAVERDLLAAEARAHYAVGRELDSAAATRRLRALDRELGLTEEALDRLYDLLRPGADRRRAKRTKAAALEIAERRLAAVQESLVLSGVSPDRIEVRRARFVVGEDDAGGAVVVGLKRRPKN